MGLSSADILQDPVFKFGDSSADAWHVRFGTANPPGDDASEEPAAIFSFSLKRTSGITLKEKYIKRKIIFCPLLHKIFIE